MTLDTGRPWSGHLAYCAVAHYNCTLGTPCSTLRRTPRTHYNCTLLDTPEAHSLCRRSTAHYRTTPSEDPAPPLPPPAAVNSGILHNEVCFCARAVCLCLCLCLCLCCACACACARSVPRWRSWWQTTNITNMRFLLMAPLR